MGVWASIVAAVFVYVGGRFLLPNVITGTSTGEGLVLNILPIALAVATVGILYRVFTG